jgi:hypothetical protein
LNLGIKRFFLSLASLNSADLFATSLTLALWVDGITSLRNCSFSEPAIDLFFLSTKLGFFCGGTCNSENEDNIKYD